jgi:hypothetical protein
MTKSTGQRKRWSTSVNLEIARLVREGVWPQEIAARLDVPIHKIKKVQTAYGVTYSHEVRSAMATEKLMRGKDYAIDIQQQIIDKRNAGFSRSKIAEALNISLMKVHTEIQRYLRTNPDKQLTARERADRVSAFKWRDVFEALSKTKFIWRGVDVDLDKLSYGLDNIKDHHPIECSCGKVFFPSLYDIMRRGQTSCGCVNIKTQLELATYVKSLVGNLEVVVDDKTILGSRKPGYPPQHLDIYIPDRKLAIEYCGLRWHGQDIRPEHATERHRYKFQKAASKGVQLITIFEDEWLTGRHKVKARLKALFRVNDESIGARKCDIVSLERGVAKQFMEDHHIFNSIDGTHYGLKYNGRLVASITVRPPGGDRVPKGSVKERTLDIVRFCVAGDISIPGGFSRLLGHIKKEHPGVDTYITYSDNRWSEGELYQSVGFVKDREAAPSYTYFKLGSSGPRFHKTRFRRSRLARDWPNDIHLLEKMSEWQFMRDHGYDRIWDCGHVRWLLKVEQPT